MRHFRPDRCRCGLPWELCPRNDAKTPFVCPRCHAVSHNHHDAHERYCGRCHVFVDDQSTQTRSWRS